MNKSPNGGGSTRTVDAVDTAFDIIEAIHELNGASMTEIARHLDVSKSAVHSHLHTLEAREFLTRIGYEYRPSYRFIDIGEALRRVHYAIYRFGHDRAEELANETGENTQLMIQEHGVGVHIFNTSGQKGIFTEKYPVGRACPLHCMAAGKAILAHLPDDDIEQIVFGAELEAVTQHTITDPEALQEELETIRERGVAFSSEEAVRGMRGVAAPVLDPDWDPIGSINVSGPISRVKGDRFREDLAQKVLEASNVIEVTIMNEMEYRTD